MNSDLYQKIEKITKIIVEIQEIEEEIKKLREENKRLREDLLKTNSFRCLNPKSSCSCTTTNLMRHGCKCGAANIER
jgi:cell shape-determining protein MreC